MKDIHMQYSRSVFTHVLALILFAANTSVSIGAATGSNLLHNASFEYESSDAASVSAFYWDMNEPDVHGDAWGSASRENWRAADGNWLATIRGTWAGAGDEGGWWQEIPANPGSVYSVNAFFFADKNWQASQTVWKLEFRDATGKKIITEVQENLEKVTEKFVEKSLSGSAPEGAAYVRVVVYAVGAGPAGALQMDNLRLVEQQSR